MRMIHARLNISMSLAMVTLVFIDPFAAAMAEQKKTDAVDLPSILVKAADYCRKLEASAFDFICREQVSEWIDPLLDAGQKDLSYVEDWSRKSSTWDKRTLNRPGLMKNSYVYDYQCVRAGRRILEKRTLLKENGKDRNEPGAELKTISVVFGNWFLVPVGLFGAAFQKDYDFEAVDRDRIDKRDVIVVEAKPKPGVADPKCLHGKAWIDPATAAILKMEWNEKLRGSADIFKRRAAVFERAPQVTLRSEFTAEKNGLRFPTRLVIEEAYIKPHGRAFVRSETTVVYKDFKFFTVEVEVDNR